MRFRVNKFQELAMSYTDTDGFPGQDQSPLFQRLREVLGEIAKTNAIAWSDTKRVTPGIANRLRINFSMTTPTGQVMTLTPHVDPDSAGSFFRIASTWTEGLDQKIVFGQLYNFCVAVGSIHHRKNRIKIAAQAVSSTSEEVLELARDDVTIDVRSRFGTRRLCQFCWRPASQPGSNTCHRHSQIDYANEIPARYMRARRHGLKTPWVLKRAWESGVIHLIGDSQTNQLIDTLRTLRDEWGEAVRTGKAQKFIDAMGPDTYKPIRSAQEYRTWTEFHAGLLRAFDASPLTVPDDPDYTAAWLPYAIKEVVRERTWEESQIATSAADVLAIRDELDGRRGWQSEAARRLKISRQRISQLAKVAEG